MTEYWPNRTTQSKPRYYAMWDQNTIYLAPTPDTAYKIELALNRNETGLSATNTTTWVSTNAPFALLYGSLVEAYTFMKGESDLLQLYTARFTEAMSRLKVYGESQENTDAFREGLVRVPKQ